MNVIEFDKLSRRDFDNGGILDEIRAALKDRDIIINTTKIAIDRYLNGKITSDQALVEINNSIVLIEGHKQSNYNEKRRMKDV